jgi:glycosyltransferase involved in cell wall biosynthesis
VRRGETDFRHDVAIYSPFGAAYYESEAPQGGGAEIQMTLLARALAARGWRVAHIVFPVADPIPAADPRLTVYQREPYHGSGPGINRLREARAVWRALRAVDARVYVTRASAVYVAAIAEFCRLHRRGMIFSSANDFDLSTRPFHGSRLKHRVYLWGLRAADAVVVQTGHQLGLARELLDDRQRLEAIPSFAEPVEEAAKSPDRFLWVSRITPHKQPLEFVRLARALPEARFTMVLAQGIDTDHGLLEQVRREAVGIANLELVGPLRRAQVLAQLERAIALVSTSEWEGMPNVFLEAWARRVPVLTLSFDPDGLIAERELGLAAAGSWKRFAEGAAALGSDRALHDRLGDNARRYLRECHSPDAVCARWEAVLRAVSA